MGERKTYRDIAMPFGKFRGTLLADVPNKYLNWLLDQEFFEEQYPQIFDMAVQEKEYRQKFDIVVE